MIVIEDTHTSYQKHFGNPYKYSLINFAKKLIDDVNFTFPNLGKFSYSLNKMIYSIQFFESLIVLKINRELCKINRKIQNNGYRKNNEDFGFEEKILLIKQQKEEELRLIQYQKEEELRLIQYQNEEEKKCCKWKCLRKCYFL